MIGLNSFNEIDENCKINKLKNILLTTLVCFLISFLTICLITPKIIDKYMVNKYVEASMMAKTITNSMNEDAIDETLLHKLKNRYFLIKKQ